MEENRMHDPRKVTQAFPDPNLLDFRVLRNLLCLEKTQVARRVPFCQWPQQEVTMKMMQILSQWLLEVCEHQQCEEGVYQLCLCLLCTYMSMSPVKISKKAAGLEYNINDKLTEDGCIHILSLGSKALMLQIWANVITGHIMFRVCADANDEAKSGVLAQAETHENIFLPGNWQHLAFTYQEQSESKKKACSKITMWVSGQRSNSSQKRPEGIDINKLVIKQAKSLNNILNQCNMFDIWRLIHPFDRDYTHLSKTHIYYSQIDMIWGNSLLIEEVKAIQIIDNVWSDHSIINIEIQNGCAQLNRSMWKLNEFLLKYKSSYEYLKHKI
ncbi:lysosomal-trafficking regulator [Pelobates cultripes]|uniref:Lysosomal-trafficking regulator n=1 Tax=Pelobates cultripes TaxID=61616 RepID=A0AAD1RFF5_PELCU|nr:lysosomal-trafficking regulator [Pelobates cultripes]